METTTQQETRNTEHLNGYLLNSAGHMVPRELVKPIDLQRNELVTKLVRQALDLQKLIKAFKDSCLVNIEEFIDLSAAQYGANLGGNKGNVTLTTYCGKYKIQRAIAESLVFDERLQVAKELIDECINRWSKDSRPEIRVLVQDAFQTDKQGKISTSRVLGLKRLDIKDEQWQNAMQAITDSIQVAGSKTYVRFYERLGSSDQYQPISLDIAAL